jgi:hypothetical protein
LTVKFYDQGLTFKIFGITHHQVAKTAAFFMSLEKPYETSSRLIINARDYGEDTMLFRRVRARCMKRISRTPLRVIEFRSLTLSALQCSLLATRPHPLHVTFQDCEFEGCGWAFVEALEKRTSSFGSLTFKGHIDLASDELERLFQVNCIEHLNLPCLDYNGKVSILPLAAPVDHLKYDLYADPDIMEGIFQSLNIVAKKLDVVIRNSGLDFPTEFLIALFRRIAAFGGVEDQVSFRFQICWFTRLCLTRNDQRRNGKLQSQCFGLEYQVQQGPTMGFAHRCPVQRCRGPHRSEFRQSRMCTMKPLDPTFIIFENCSLATGKSLLQMRTEIFIRMVY